MLCRRHKKEMVGFQVNLLLLGVFIPGQCYVPRDMQEFTRLWVNKKDFNDTGCNISAGWNLTGRDWGCCGSYEGCCKMASKLCYFHDTICQCCRFGWFICGPECKPDIECFLTIEKVEENFSNPIQSSSVNMAIELLTSPSTDTNKTSSQNALYPTNTLFSGRSRAKMHISPTEKTDVFNVSDVTSNTRNVSHETEPISNKNSKSRKRNDPEVDRGGSKEHNPPRTKAELQVNIKRTNNIHSVKKITEKVEEDFGLIPVDISSNHKDIVEGSGEGDDSGEIM